VADRLERLVNLTATLLETRRFLTLDELAERIEPRYPDDLAARRRAFERDKDALRELGIPIRVDSADGPGGTPGYRIHPDDYYLADLGLSDDELAALHVAATAVHLGEEDARDGLRKLGGLSGPAAGASVARMPISPVLADVFAAIAARATVTFSYRGATRLLDPYGVVARWGHWYVVGHDRDRDAPRAFRADRIEGAVTAGPAGAFEPPADLDAGSYLRDDPLRYGEEPPLEALVLVDAPRAAWVVAQLGDEAVRERRDDGSVVVALSVVNREAFRVFVLELRDHATVLGPAVLRDELVAWLTAIEERAR
jgi:proteasome accessory factor B